MNSIDQNYYGTMVLRLGYDGEAYSGFAIQEKQSHVHTVAGELQTALRLLFRRDVDLTCAGRTDAGVHARSQYVSIPVYEDECASFNAQKLLRSLSAILPDDIRVYEIYRADKSFSARFDACSRHYRYRIFTGPTGPLFTSDWSWWIRSAESDLLDIDSMNLAASYLQGEHDFKSFCKAQSAIGKPTCRYIQSAYFERETVLGETAVVFDIIGNAFLHSMVRTIVGTLTEVGIGRRPASWVLDVLQACNRNAAGACAPAKGLTFWDVRYPENTLKPW